MAIALKFNTIKIINTIQKDGLLQKLYKAKSSTTYQYRKLIAAAEAGTLTDKQVEVLKHIFNETVKFSDLHSTIYTNVDDGYGMNFNPIKVIKFIHDDSLFKKLYEATAGTFQYRKLLDAAKTETLTAEQVEALENIYQNIIIVSPERSFKYSKLKEVRRKTPIRYGKKQLEADIANAGGNATPSQSTLLLLAELETLKNTIAYRAIQDHYKGTNKLSDDNHQKIQEAVRSFNTTLIEIL